MSDTTVSLGGRTWSRIHAVALCGAWDERRGTALHHLIDGVPGLWTGCALGQLIVGPTVEADGSLAVYIGERVGSDIEWFSRATDADLEVSETERSELFRIAEQSDRVAFEPPDDIEDMR
jgi:hypothetical protein